MPAADMTRDHPLLVEKLAQQPGDIRCAQCELTPADIDDMPREENEVRGVFREFQFRSPGALQEV